MNRRTFLKTLGAVGAVAVLPVKWVAEQVPDYSFVSAGRASGDAFWSGFNTVRIAAANASAESKRLADVVCTGHNDGTTIQAVIDRLGPGGTVFMTGGTFYMDRGIDLTGRAGAITGCHFIGTPGTVLRLSG